MRGKRVPCRSFSKTTTEVVPAPFLGTQVGLPIPQAEPIQLAWEYAPSTKRRRTGDLADDVSSDDGAPAYRVHERERYLTRRTVADLVDETNLATERYTDGEEVVGGVEGTSANNTVYAKPQPSVEDAQDSSSEDMEGSESAVAMTEALTSFRDNTTVNSNVSAAADAMRASFERARANSSASVDSMLSGYGQHAKKRAQTYDSDASDVSFARSRSHSSVKELLRRIPRDPHRPNVIKKVRTDRQKLNTPKNRLPSAASAASKPPPLRARLVEDPDPGTQCFIGSHVNRFLGLNRGALYPRFPQLWARPATLDEKRVLTQLGVIDNSRLRASLVRADQVEDIVRSEYPEKLSSLYTALDTFSLPLTSDDADDEPASPNGSSDNAVAFRPNASDSASAEAPVAAPMPVAAVGPGSR